MKKSSRAKWRNKRGDGLRPAVLALEGGERNVGSRNRYGKVGLKAVGEGEL